MLRVSTLTIVLLITFCSSAVAEIYKWKDENGKLHFATSIDDVPEKYLDQIGKVSKVGKVRETSNTPTVPAKPQAEQAGDVTGEASDQQSFEVPYTDEGSTRRVIIDVTFNGSVTVPMALDTGAPGLVISVELAERLGLFRGDRGTLFTPTGGIGGTTIAVRTIVDSVSVGDARSEVVPTTITAPLSDSFEGLVGMDFLENHTIKIDTRDKVVVFQQVEPDPNSRGGHDEDWWRQTFEDFRETRDLWRGYLNAVEASSTTEPTAFAEFQAREAERLLQRLHSYASNHAVPQHWR